MAFMSRVVVARKFGAPRLAAKPRPDVRGGHCWCVVRTVPDPIPDGAFVIAILLTLSLAAAHADTLPQDASGAVTTPRRMDGTLDLTRVFQQPISDDTLRTRRKAAAFEYSDGYHKRLALHRALSWAMIPLFVGSYVTGDRLLKDGGAAPNWARKLHSPFATGTAVVFSVNTVTGILNLIESNKDPNGRTKRWIHSIAMIAADAGFTYAGTKLAADAQQDPALRSRHRNLALASMGVSVASWASMLILK